MIGKLVRIELEMIDSPGDQLAFKVADFGRDGLQMFDRNEAPLFGTIKTETYSARYLRYPGRPDEVFFVRTDDFELFDALVKLVEGDRLRLHNEGFREGNEAGFAAGRRHFNALPWWKRLTKRWS